MTGMLKRKRVAVLLGGPGSEREVSLRSGAAVAGALRSLGAIVEEIDVRDAGFSLPPSIDLAYNMVHGTFGEDGQIQEILERIGVPYTGEGIRGSHLAFDKILTKTRFDEEGVPTGQWHVINASKDPPSGIQRRRAYYQGSCDAPRRA
jgi:D-alanine-D-alanine ligase